MINGKIYIEINSKRPEKFMNLLWENNIQTKNIVRKNYTSYYMEIELKDYKMMSKISKRTKTKIKVLSRKGAFFTVLKIKQHITMALGALLFVGLLFYFSTYIWGIDIVTEKYVAPYEIRQILFNDGIKPGTKKKDINVFDIQKKILNENHNIVWARARIEGSKLIIQVAERNTPPDMTNKDNPCNVIANKDAQIIRIYSTAGTTIVKQDDIVRKGDILIEGRQGKEENSYLVHASGDVIAKTFYESSKKVSFSEPKRVRTGNKIENIYIKIGNKKIYLKKGLNKFDKYDKIEDSKLLLNYETYYEIKEQIQKMDETKVIKDAYKELYDKLILSIGKEVKIVDEIKTSEPLKNGATIKLVLVGEENIAVQDENQ